MNQKDRQNKKFAFRSSHKIIIDCWTYSICHNQRSAIWLKIGWIDWKSIFGILRRVSLRNARDSGSGSKIHFLGIRDRGWKFFFYETGTEILNFLICVGIGIRNLKVSRSGSGSVLKKYKILGIGWDRDPAWRPLVINAPLLFSSTWRSFNFYLFWISLVF